MSAHKSKECRYHIVPWGSEQIWFAEAALLVEKGVIKWLSGTVHEDKGTWYSDETYIVRDDELYDKLMAAMRHQYSAFPGYDCLHQEEYLKTFRWATREWSSLQELPVA